MCFVIVTSRTLIWTLLTIVTTLAMLAAVTSPHWLRGAPRTAPVKSVTTHGNPNFGLAEENFGRSIPSEHLDPVLPPPVKNANESGPHSVSETVYHPSVGIFNRCSRIHHVHDVFSYNCATFVTGFGMPSDEFSNFWKASLIFFSFGLSLMTFTVVTSIIGCCIRAIVKKSIFTISGTVQAVAGLFYILGLVLYPAGWGSRRVILLCGDQADYYWPGDCTVGWGFYVAVVSTLVTFVCSVLSVQAEISTSTDKVQDEIYDGKNLICLL